MKKYNLTVMRPQFLSSTHEINELNSLYSMWRKTFSAVVNPKGAQVDPDDFFRQNFIFCLKHEAEIMGFALGTVFDLRVQNHKEHHFIGSLNPFTVEKIRQSGLDRILSLEYLTLETEWRKKSTEVLWAEVLIAVGILFADHNPEIIDGLIGTPRNDIKMNNVGNNAGFTTIQDEIFKMDYPCAVQINPIQKNRIFKNPQTDEMARSLWNSRIDLINPIQSPNQQPIKKTA